MIFTVHVMTMKGPFTFECIAHKSVSKKSRLMPSEFYGDNPPKGVHYELELLTEVWSHAHARLIHYHETNPSKRTFVCWTGHLPSPRLARLVFQMWCVGTAYTMSTGRDFAELQNVPDVPKEFLEFFRINHAIRIRG